MQVRFRRTNVNYQIHQIFDLFKSKRKLKYIQIGVSSRCFLSCIMCPRTCFPDIWKSTDMTFETFTRIAEFFSLAQNVYLSGWGEPLLNPHFTEMIKIAKKAGCNVGFTTNGVNLNDNLMIELIEAQTDLISISMAGGTKITHDSIRKGSNFESLKTKLRRINELKLEKGSEKPQILLLFMMSKNNLDELPISIELAANLETSGIVATNIDYVGNKDQEELKAFSCDEMSDYDKQKISDAENLADKLGIPFHAFPLELSPQDICTEDPLNNLYISETGKISPCVYLNLPMNYIPRIFCGKKTTVYPLIFGNVITEDLLSVWEKTEYTSFRQIFKNKKKDMSASLPDLCKTCYKAYGI